MKPESSSTVHQSQLGGESPLALETLLEPASPPAINPSGVFVGRIAGLSEAGEQLVEVPGVGQFYPRSTVQITAADIGREVALMFECGDLGRPLIMGLMHVPAATVAKREPPQEPLQATIDDERIELRADKEIVLQCGKASITLTRAGKILLRGAFLSSRSTGVNCIHGGSVQIN